MCLLAGPIGLASDPGEGVEGQEIIIGFLVAEVSDGDVAAAVGHGEVDGVVV